MTAELHEILHTGDVIDAEGNIRSAHDFSHDDYPDPNPEQIHAMEILQIIDAWEAAQRFKALKHLGANNPSVRAHGGLRGCNEKSKHLELEARRTFLKAHNYPVEEPHSDYEDAVDEYYEGVRAWARFRKELSNDDIRSNIKTIHEQKIPPMHSHEG